MTGTHNKALVVNSFWAKIFSSLIVMLVAGGITFAWNVNADTTNLKLQMEQMQQAALPSRMDKLEERVDAGFRVQEKTLDKLGDKLDRIEQKLSDNVVRTTRPR